MCSGPIITTAQAKAEERISASSSCLCPALSCLLSFKPETGRWGFKTTAAAQTGPAKHPRPASSKPHSKPKPPRSARNSGLGITLDEILQNPRRPIPGIRIEPAAGALFETHGGAAFQSEHPFSPAIGIACFGIQSRVASHLGQRSSIRRQDGNPERKGLQNRQTETLEPAREEQCF